MMIFNRQTSIVLALTVLLLLIGGGGSIAKGQTAVKVSEQQVVQKLGVLNKQSPIRLDYNKHVQAYIDAYTIKRREHLGRIVGRGELYFPMFEACLDKYGLPLELKYLAVVESALDPKAKSTSAAMGLWQFLYNASTMFDLEVNSFVDERCDPEKSTEAACKYLQYLFRNFNDWHLALAAYNVGVGEVKKAMAKSGKTRFWDLAPYLPEQARGYVPAFIAANYVMTSYADYQISVTKPKYGFHEIDSVLIDKSLTFEQISKAADITIDDVSGLNPQYTKNFVPVAGVPVKIVLPLVKVGVFMRAVKTLPEAPTPQASLARTPFSTLTVVHTVGRGEYFHKIAIRYNCCVEDIMKWNHLKSQNLFAGQRLTIFVKKPLDRFFFVRSEVDDDFFAACEVGMPLAEQIVVK